MNIVLPLAEMSAAEKLDLIDTIWEDLSRHPEDVPAPAWHGDVLRQRREAMVDGVGRSIPLGEVEERLRDLMQ